jgi:NTE family protein
MMYGEAHSAMPARTDGMSALTEQRPSGAGRPESASPSDIARRAAPKAPASRRDPKLVVCLSGGGYRAMLYHLGALRRLNEFGLLGVVDRFSSVSGGSITAAVLARDWEALRFDEDGIAQGFESVERAVFDLACKTIDWQSGVVGAVPGTTGARQLARRYRRLLFGEATLQDLPSERPRFVFNTTNMATGNLFRWSCAYGADHSVGRIDRPTLGLAEVVAASSAFPPFLSPLRIRPPGTIVDHTTGLPVNDPPSRLWLTDGGVYDNLGMQTAQSFHTVLASDGGAPLTYASRVGHNWGSQTLRTVGLVYAQVSRLRRHQFVEELMRGERLGALWTIATRMTDYTAPDTLPCPFSATRMLADLPTRLAKMPVETRRRLINWGYASADAAIRSYVEPSLPAPSGMPHPGGVG